MNRDNCQLAKLDPLTIYKFDQIQYPVTPLGFSSNSLGNTGLDPAIVMSITIIIIIFIIIITVRIAYYEHNLWSQFMS